MIDACSDPVPSSAWGRCDCNRRSSDSRRLSTRPIRRMASRPSRGRLPCAARPSVSTRTHSNPLCATAMSRSVGSVTTAASARHAAASASAPKTRVLFVNNGSNNEAAARADVLLGNLLRGSDHGSNAALHVLCAASVQPPVAVNRPERVFHACNADGIEMAAEHQRRARVRGRRARRRHSGALARSR